MNEKNLSLVADGLMSINDACKFLAVSRTTLYSLITSGTLMSVKIGKSIRVPRRAAVELAANGLSRPAAKE